MSNARMPALFVGHGSPMNALEDNLYSQAWKKLGKTLPRPRAIVCISAHWETVGTKVTAMVAPQTIHDFGGFPPALTNFQYPAPGSPEVAALLQQAAGDIPITFDHAWGLDHGAWSVLCCMYPQADIPVVQLSLDRNKSPVQHYALGKTLAALRTQGVLLLGSGNIVHNLQRAVWRDEAFPLAVEFDANIAAAITTGDHQAIIDWQQWGDAARLSVPTAEHFLPLLYILAAQQPHEEISFLTDHVTYGAMSMRTVKIG